MLTQHNMTPGNCQVCGQPVPSQFSSDSLDGWYMKNVAPANPLSLRSSPKQAVSADTENWELLQKAQEIAELFQRAIKLGYSITCTPEQLKNACGDL